MSISICATDSEIEANAPLVAAGILAHPLALQLPSAVIDLLAGIAAGDVQADQRTVRVVRLTLVHVDRMENHGPAA